MGALHEGHLSLIKFGLKKHDVVVCSIFVNPAQFGPGEDFERYPRTLNSDLDLLGELKNSFPNRKLVVFAPVTTAEFDRPETLCFVGLNRLANILEGNLRPGHFEGVCQIVLKLLNTVQPKVLYLGKKDYQQFVILKQMVRDFFIATQVVGLPIVRDPKGLPLSSRNRYLSTQQKDKACSLSEELSKLEQIWKEEGAVKFLERWPDRKSKLVQDENWNYLELRDTMLREFQKEKSHAVLLGNYQVDNVRILDNRELSI